MLLWLVRILIALLIFALIEWYFFYSLKRASDSFPVKPLRKTPVIIGISLNLMPLYLILSVLYNVALHNRIYLPESRLADWLVIYPFWISLLLVIQLILFFIPIDFIELFLRLLNIYHKRVRLFGKIKIWLFVLFLFYVPLRVVHDYYSVKITKLKIKVNNLPKALDNFKIGFVSDFHIDRYTDSLRATNYINKLNRLKPDVVLIGGDFISRGNKYIKDAAKLLSNIQSTYGVYSCAGDHDYWAYSNAPRKSISAISLSLASQGIELLDNLNIFIPVDSSEILITSVTNTYVKKISQKELSSLVDTGKYGFKIFLTHQPRKLLLEAAVKNNYNIYLCGHTHGGQLSFLFPFVSLTPSSLESRYVSGKYFYGKLLLYVCNGLGMSIAPVRYNSTPEVVLITLVK